MITEERIRGMLQVALLGSVTPNLRVVQVTFDEKSIDLFFYYEKTPSEEEEEIGEEISTEIMSHLVDIIPVEIHRIVLPTSEKIPDFGLRVYHRRE